MDVARYREQDACPGALQVHQAADGALVRIRLPGGELSPAQLAVSAGVAADHGGGTLELTSRGSLQIRGITDTAEVAAQVAAAGLLPSATHERARNIVASPLSGRAGGLADVRLWVGELDAAIQADGVLSGLPGRFWFGIDDGRGDVSGLHVDAGCTHSTAARWRCWYPAWTPAYGCRQPKPRRLWSGLPRSFNGSVESAAYNRTR